MNDKERAYHEDEKPAKPTWLKELLTIIKTVRHGSVTLVIQDGIVIQIDKSEKFRLKKL